MASISRQRDRSRFFYELRVGQPCLDADCSDRSARSDVLLREEPDEEEDDEEDEGNSKEDDDDEDEGDDGYSE